MLSGWQQMNFGDWLDLELKQRDWIPATLANKANIDAGNLSRVMSGQRTASPDMCNSIAKVLGLPPEHVFRKAGLLPDLPIPEGDENWKELYDYFKRLKPSERKMVLDFAVWRFRNQDD